MVNEVNNVDESAVVHQIEEALHVEIVPGTEIMAQVGGVHFVEDKGRGVLVPQPSNNPNDPLNWSLMWKIMAMSQMAMLAFTQGFGILSVGPQVPYYMKEWDRSLEDVLQFTGIVILVLGFSNFFWVPLATLYGRRPCILLSTLVSLAACIWRAKANSYNSFLGACIVHGIGSGTLETLPPMLIADVMFLQERGFYMNLYTWVFFAASLTIGPIVSGTMADRYGWRSFWWLNVAFYVAVFIFQFFGLPETKWTRKHGGDTEETETVTAPETPVRDSDGSVAPSRNANRDSTISQSATVRGSTYEYSKEKEMDWDKSPSRANRESVMSQATTTRPSNRDSMVSQTTTVNGNGMEPISKGPRENEPADEITEADLERAAISTPINHVDKYLHKGTPSFSQFSMNKTYGGMKDIMLSIWIPFQLFSFPIAMFGSIMFAMSACVTLIINFTQSDVFAAPPYNFSASAVGLTNLAPLVGCTLGLITAGPLSDYVSMRLTKRNGGIREPEMRLPTLIPYACFTLISCLVTAYGYQNEWDWKIIVIVGYTAMAIQVSALPAIALTYAIDSYKPITGELLVTATIVKNLWGYGLSKFLTPWIAEVGFIKPIMCIMALTMGFTLCAIPLYFKGGKALRRYTKNSHVHLRE